MKQANLRICVTAEDAVTLEQIQTSLTAHLNTLGTEHLGTASDDPADGLGARVFWQTSEVKQRDVPGMSSAATAKRKKL